MELDHYLAETSRPKKRRRDPQKDAIVEKHKEQKILRDQGKQQFEQWRRQVLDRDGAHEPIQKLQDLIDLTLGDVDPNKLNFLQKVGWNWALIASTADVRYIALKMISDMEMAIAENAGIEPLDDEIPAFDGTDNMTFMQHVKRILNA